MSDLTADSDRALVEELRQDCRELCAGDHSEGACVFARSAARIEALADDVYEYARTVAVLEDPELSERLRDAKRILGLGDTEGADRACERCGGTGQAWGDFDTTLQGCNLCGGSGKRPASVPVSKEEPQ